MSRVIILQGAVESQPLMPSQSPKTNPAIFLILALLFSTLGLVIYTETTFRVGQGPAPGVFTEEEYLTIPESPTANFPLFDRSIPLKLIPEQSTNAAL